MRKKQKYTLRPILVFLFVLAIPLTFLYALQKQTFRQEAAPSDFALTSLHTSGNKIINGTGQTVTLHGVNRPSFEYSCVDGSAIAEGPLNQAEVTAMKSWNINAVRVVLNEDCWLGIHGMAPAVSGTAYQTAVANYVNLLTQNNMAVIINLHFNGDGTTKAVEQEPMADRTNSNTFWTSVATAFKSNSAVLFEPYNEPHDITWTCWRDGGTCAGVPFQVAGMQEMVSAIRSTGATNIIIATGINWGSDLSSWQQYKPNDPANQLAAGWHTYNDGLSCEDQTCWDTTLQAVLTTNPIVATEIGEFDCAHTHIDNVTNWLDSKSQNYFAWAWTPGVCATEPALISDWNGTPTQTFGQGYKDHLLGLVPSPTVITVASPTSVQPTNYCLGNCLISVTPTVEPSPVPSQILPSANPSNTPAPSAEPSVFPSESQPSPTTSPPPTQNNSFIALLLQFLTMLITLIMKLFGKA